MSIRDRVRIVEELFAATDGGESKVSSAPCAEGIAGMDTAAQCES